MKIIEPSIELWHPMSVKQHVARCARVCYKREVGNDDATYNRLINNKHFSMFRHVSYYAIIKYDAYVNAVIKEYIKNPYIDIRYNDNGNKIYVATNGNFMLDNCDKFITNIINNNQVTDEHFANTEIGFKMMRYTFSVITQISTSREFNRVSPNNIAERSTRYVYDDGTICRPHWLSKNDADIFNDYLDFNFDELPFVTATYIKSCSNSFHDYTTLIADYGVHRQDARGLLPLDTATQCVYTYSVDEWERIIKLRYYGTTGKPHPNAKIIAKMIKDELNELGYNI